MRKPLPSLKKSILASVLLAPLIGVTMPAAAQATPYWYDTFSAIGAPKPAKTSVLKKGVRYVARVRGTYSIYTDWTVGCGISEPQPIFKSPGTQNGQVMADAEFYFADRAKPCARRTPSLGRYSGFRIKTKRKYTNPVLLGPVPVTARPDHTYRYAVIGAGRRARFQRIPTTHAEDNYGRFRITVRRARAADCANEGYVSWGFITQAECEADLPGLPAPPAPATAPPLATL
jgi:hypothetical protein